ncbi:UNVERIFIED_CONTAM: hypothetical protein Sangu_3226800 [Sesamum angustifolium]|uniref:Reverse transcriptase zinc-binding domain-containing protein n=1 Tax=Sesamum angustifolium TaxID=2727405 RepID=A0AAW2JHI6_9LAMI
MNNALMGKHLWQILTKKHDSIWVSWISRYKLRHGTLWAANDKEGSWTWKKLLKLRHQLIKGIQFRVGDGTEFKLWLDPWHPAGALIHRYPHGPLVTGIPLDSPLSTVITEGNWNWPSEYHIDVNEIITKLPAIHSGTNDTIIWNSSSGNYSAKDAYDVFSEVSNSVEWASLFHAPFIHPDTNSSSGLQFWNVCQHLTNHGATPLIKTVYCAIGIKLKRTITSFFAAPTRKQYCNHLVANCDSIGHIQIGIWV